MENVLDVITLLQLVKTATVVLEPTACLVTNAQKNAYHQAQDISVTGMKLTQNVLKIKMET